MSHTHKYLEITVHRIGDYYVMAAGALAVVYKILKKAKKLPVKGVMRYKITKSEFTVVIEAHVSGKEIETLPQDVRFTFAHRELPKKKDKFFAVDITGNDEIFEVCNSWVEAGMPHPDSEMVADLYALLHGSERRSSLKLNNTVRTLDLIYNRIGILLDPSAQPDADYGLPTDPVGGFRDSVDDYRKKLQAVMIKIYQTRDENAAPPKRTLNAEPAKPEAAHAHGKEEEKDPKAQPEEEGKDKDDERDHPSDDPFKGPELDYLVESAWRLVESVRKIVRAHQWRSCPSGINKMDCMQPFHTPNAKQNLLDVMNETRALLLAVAADLNKPNNTTLLSIDNGLLKVEDKVNRLDVEMSLTRNGPSVGCFISWVTIFATIGVVIAFTCVTGIGFHVARMNDHCVADVGSADTCRGIDNSGYPDVNIGFDDVTVPAAITLFSALVTVFTAIITALTKTGTITESACWICDSQRQAIGRSFEFFMIVMLWILSFCVNLSIIVVALEEKHTSTYVATSLGVGIGVPVFVTVATAFISQYLVGPKATQDEEKAEQKEMADKKSPKK